VLTVVVDSNAIAYRDWRLTSAPWRVLAYRVRSGMCSLVVPELVVREVVGRYREAVAKTTEKARAVGASFTTLGIATPVPGVDIDAAVVEYERALRAAIGEAGGTIEKPPDVPILDLADRAIDRRPPFDAKGNGFRDAVVWEHVVATSEQGSFTVLVTGDKAFVDPKSDELADELRDEVGGRVQVAVTVAEHLRATGIEDPAATARVTTVVEAEREQLAENVKLLLPGADVEPDDAGVSVVIEEGHDPVHVVVVGVTAAKDADGLLLVDLDVEADVDLYVERWDVGTTMGTSASATVSLATSATFDTEQGTLDNLSLGTVRIDLDRVLTFTEPW
jgi:PIN domain